MGALSVRGVAVGLLVYAAALTAMALALPVPFFERGFSEHGIVEMSNAIAWLLGALVFAWIAWRDRDLVAMLAVFPFLAAALREADMHKAFTGYSVLKVSFWLDGGFEPMHKLIAAVVLLPTLVSLCWLMVLLVRRLRLGSFGRPAMAILLFTIGLMVFSKVCDRAPAILYESYGVELSPFVKRWMQALEEGLELLLPFFFGWAYFLRGQARERAPAS